MADVYEILPEPIINQTAFILDHGKTVDGALKYQDDVFSYGYNTKQFNRLVPGAYVLNRHPGKFTTDRKFEIYGGGYIEKITPIDDQGNVVATISHAFKIDPPIKQGDTFLENYDWKSKQKKVGTWEHFWNQYGMNTISIEDFNGLTANARCIPINPTEFLESDPDISNEEVTELVEASENDFIVTFEDGPTRKIPSSKKKRVARIIDFDKVQASRNRIGALGEEIVFDLLSKQASDNGFKAPVRVSVAEGDGIGYDIRYFGKDEEEIHVEVKSSIQRYSDGFVMSQNEIEASQDKNHKYLIYRVYDLNAKTRECKIKIYEGPIDDKSFKLVPRTIAVYMK